MPQAPNLLLHRALEMLADGLNPDASEIGKNTTWKPQPGPQTELLTTYRDEYEVFFGGGRGGGKTDGELGDWMDHSDRFGGSARGIFIRRFHIDLEDVVRRARELLTPKGWLWNATSHTFRAPNGSTLKIRHLKDELVAERYQGHAYTRVYVEECQQWPTPAAIDLMRATLRSAEGVPVGIRLTGNPGGPGHAWVKGRYVDPAPAGYQKILDPETGKYRVFIPSRMDDNRILMEQDPEYEKRIMGVGDPELAKAWRWGDWDIAAGGFFMGVWQGQFSVLRPFEIPPTWRFFYSFDWGSAKPASLGCYGVSDGTPIISGWCRGRRFARGSIVRFAEDYTILRDAHGLEKPNEGLRLSNQEIGVRFVRFLTNLKKNWAYGVADPSIFAEQGGPSIYSQMREGPRSAELDYQLRFEPADNSRVAGWQRVIAFLRNASEPEQPGFYVFNTCRHFLRTVPTISRDLKNPDDIDTEAEDHVADEVRYAVMSVSPIPKSRTTRARL